MWYVHIDNTSSVLVRKGKKMEEKWLNQVLDESRKARQAAERRNQLKSTGSARGGASTGRGSASKGTTGRDATGRDMIGIYASSRESGAESSSRSVSASFGSGSSTSTSQAPAGKFDLSSILGARALGASSSTSSSEH